MARKLFVIGNGFDLHHHMPSAYSDFGHYVEAIDPTIHRLIQDYLFVDKDFWSRFEARLASFDADAVIDHAQQFLVSYGADDWSDAYHHDFEYEIEQVVGGLSHKMRSHFAAWIRTLSMPAPGSFSAVRCIDRGGSFLSFNYTPTLQQVYGVPDANVLHIHGKAGDQDAQIVLGHGWERSNEDLLTSSANEDTDTRVAAGYQLIDDYFEKTFKPTRQIIAHHQSWFESLADVSEIFVFGHSLAPVDAPYFQDIIERIDPFTPWTVSYRAGDTPLYEEVSALGIADAFVTFAPLVSL